MPWEKSVYAIEITGLRYQVSQTGAGEWFVVGMKVLEVISAGGPESRMLRPGAERDYLIDMLDKWGYGAARAHKLLAIVMPDLEDERGCVPDDEFIAASQGERDQLFEGEVFILKTTPIRTKEKKTEFTIHDFELAPNDYEVGYGAFDPNIDAGGDDDYVDPF